MVREVWHELWEVWQRNANGISLTLSLLGFGFTWWQLIRTRKSADAAKLAATAAFEAVAHVDTVSDIAAAQGGLREVQVALRGARYETALLRAQALRELVFRLRSRPGFEASERQVSIQELLTNLRKLQDALEQVLMEPSRPFSPRATNKMLADAAVELGGWAEALRYVQKEPDK